MREPHDDGWLRTPHRRGALHRRDRADPGEPARPRDPRRRLRDRARRRGPGPRRADLGALRRAPRRPPHRHRDPRRAASSGSGPSSRAISNSPNSTKSAFPRGGACDRSRSSSQLPRASRAETAPQRGHQGRAGDDLPVSPRFYTTDFEELDRTDVEPVRGGVEQAHRGAARRPEQAPLHPQRGVRHRHVRASTRPCARSSWTSWSRRSPPSSRAACSTPRCASAPRTPTSASCSAS